MSSITRYGGGVVPSLRKHWYAGTDALLPGYAMCYDESAANAAATAENVRLGNVVAKPATANLFAFAGIVAPGAGITGPGYVMLTALTGLPHQRTINSMRLLLLQQWKPMQH